MRDHAIVSPHFWTGETGRQLRKDADAQRIALYLMTCPSANMIGLYYIPIPLISHEVGISLQGASKGLVRLYEVGFCAYDAPSEVVFIYQMARYQIGEVIKDKDLRYGSVLKLLSQMRNCIFYNDFLTRYNEPFRLNLKPLPSPLRAPRAFDQDQDQDQDQEKEKDLNPKSSPVLRDKPTRPPQKNRAKLSTDYSPGFLAWWEAYPHDRRSDKAKSFEVWQEEGLEGKADEYVEKIERLKRTTWNRNGDDRQFIKTPLPYLNARRYEDELVPLPVVTARERLSDREYRNLQHMHHFLQENCSDQRPDAQFYPQLTTPGDDFQN